MKKLFFATLLCCLRPSTVWACSVCFGDKDSNLTQGFIMAIITLFLIVTTVLGSIIWFLIQFNQRAKLMNPNV